MGRQIIDPSTDLEKLIVVSQLADRLRRSLGDWRKYGEGADKLLAPALLLVLGLDALRTIFQQLGCTDLHNPNNGALPDND